MNNPKDIVPFWNKARQAMLDITTLLEEAEKDIMDLIKPQMISTKIEKDHKVYLLSDVDINIGTLGQRIDLYFLSPLGCNSKLATLKERKKKKDKSLTEEELADMDILQELAEGRINCSRAYNELDTIDGVLIRVRLTPTIEEVQRIVVAGRFDISVEQSNLKCAVDSSLVYNCPM
ncbi:MAG: hypothetical protein KBS65_06935 [Prevotella sp.]|nr:hypothetical protein [Candidatus Equicola stercoris]